MKGDPKSWRTSAQSPEAKKLELMRRAKTHVESTHGLGGLPKEKGHKPKPITLPKMPWDDEPAPYAHEKQIVQVLEAVKTGCNTSRDVAAEMNISVAVASAIISEMISAGMLRHTGRTVPNQNEVKSGPPFRVFELVGPSDAVGTGKEPS